MLGCETGVRDRDTVVRFLWTVSKHGRDSAQAQQDDSRIEQHCDSVRRSMATQSMRSMSVQSIFKSFSQDLCGWVLVIRRDMLK